MGQAPLVGAESTGGVPAGSGWACGTFGELMQGVLPDGRHFLVTLPISRGTTASFRYDSGSPEIRLSPPDKRKSARLARLALESLGRPGGGELRIISDLPEGKGLASSSADLVATARAVADAFGTVLEATAIESLLRGIEPSDGVMHDDIVAFYHREVRLHSRLGSLSPLAIIGYDEGGQVDTVEFNRRRPAVSAAERREYAAQLDRLARAVADTDLCTVGEVATWSACRDARRRRRPAIRLMLRACAEVGGYGVVAAHSGTMLGVLVDADDPQLLAKASAVRSACGAVDLLHYRPAGQILLARNGD